MSIDVMPHVTMEMVNREGFSWDGLPTVNMSNGNACRMLGHLGFTTEQITDAASGGLTISPMDLMGRVNVFLALPEHIQGSETVRLANMVVFGTDAEYLTFRAQEIYEIAEWCDANGYEVSVH